MLWREFQNIVAAELPGIPAPLIDQYARIVAIDFCETSQLHVVDLDAVDIVANTATYSLDAPSNDTVVAGVLSAWIRSAPLKFIPLTQLRRTGVYWPDLSGPPEGYTQLDPANITLYPKPTASVTGGLHLNVVLKPSRQSSGLEGWIAEKYFFDLASGIKSRLMAMPGQSWSSKEGAATYYSMYADARDDAARNAGRSIPRGQAAE